MARRLEQSGRSTSSVWQKCRSSWMSPAGRKHFPPLHGINHLVLNRIMACSLFMVIAIIIALSSPCVKKVWRNLGACEAAVTCKVFQARRSQAFKSLYCGGYRSGRDNGVQTCDFNTSSEILFDMPDARCHIG